MEIDKFLERGQLALRKRHFAQAAELFRQVQVARPGHPGALHGLLSCYRRQSEEKGGASFFDRAAARTARTAALGLRGAARAELRVRTADAGLQKDPFDGELLAQLAQALEELGHPEAALAAWTWRTEVEAADAAAWKAAGKLHFAMRRFEEAEQCLDQAHKLHPRDPEVEKLRKNLAAEGTLRRTRFETASSSRELARPVSSSAPAGAPADPLGALLAALGARPRDEELRRRAVQSLADARRWPDALRLVEEGLAETTEAAPWEDLRGELHLRRLDEQIAGAAGAERERLAGERLALELCELERRVAWSPQDAPLRVRHGRALLRAGRVEPAIEAFQAARGDERLKTDAQHGLGLCFLEQGLLPLAARQLEGALAGAGGVAGDRGKEICYHLALVKERQGDRAGALARYLEIYEVDVRYRDVAAKVSALQS